MSQFAGSRDFIIQNSVFHSHNSGPKGGFESLQEYVAHGAFHNSKERFDAPKCHPNTRVAIIKKITDWISGLNEDTREAFIMWLYGAAGAGKSAIAQTVARILDVEHFILATFFFKRDDPQRGTAEFLVTTLAYQLAVGLPKEFRDQLAQVFEKDPLITTRSIETQFNALIRGPLVELVQSGFSSNDNIVLIIDGLDECKDSDVQVQVILASFSLLRSRDIPLKILIASRPEFDISGGFGVKPSIVLARLALYDDYESEEDIRTFLVDKFNEIKSQHRRRAQIPTTWPSQDAVVVIMYKSSGQFIYASTVIKYIASPRHVPMDRLKIVHGIQPPKSGDNPFAELDALYHYILSGLPSEDLDLMLKIIRFVVFTPDPCFLTDLDVLFPSSPGDVQLLLQDLGSLVEITDYGSVRLLHASLKDYLLDKSRSKNLFLDPSKIHGFYSKLCIARIMDLESSTSAMCTRRPLDSSTSLPRSFWFLFETFFYHCPRANSNEFLVEAVLNLSLDRCHAIEITRAYQMLFVNKYFDYLDSISKNWADARIYQFYLNEIASFKQAMKSRIFSDLQYVPACFLLALLFQESNIWVSYLIPTTYPKSENPKRFFRLGNTFTELEVNNHKLRQCIRDTLEDSIISSHKPSEIPNISASAAIYTLQYLSTWEHSYGLTITRFGRSCRYLRTRTNSPAQSHWYRRSINTQHTMYGKYEDFRQFVLSAKDRRFVDANFYPGWNWHQSLYSHHSVYISALLKLPAFLNKAGYSAELVSLANHARIKSHDKHYIGYWGVDEGRAGRVSARAAIKAYLERVADGDIY